MVGETTWARERQAGDTFTEGLVEADGFNVRYWEDGDGAALIVLHGGGGPPRVDRVEPSCRAIPGRRR